MAISTNTVNPVINILKEEIETAEGCTEPVALALVAAKARKVLGDIPDSVDVYVSGNMIKNVKSVVVPNSGGMVGTEAAVAMGIVAGDPQAGLLVISEVAPERLKDVNDFLASANINVIHDPTNIKLYIRIVARRGGSSAAIEVKHLHTNITKVERNGEMLVSVPCNDADFTSPLSDRQMLSVQLIYDMAKSIDVDAIAPTFERVIDFNTAVAQEGLRGEWGVNIGKCILGAIEEGSVYGDDVRNRCASFAAAGSDARMSGCPLPVMTTSGSGNQGMTASLPIISYCKERGLDHETLLRALFFSHLTTVHIKTNVGRLSAYCGVICASAAVSGALAFLDGADAQTVSAAIVNTLGNLSGVICDGAKASCAMKIASGVNAAFDSALLAEHHRELHGGDGIVGGDVEETIKNIGELAQTGMQRTDEVILDIMTH